MLICIYLLSLGITPSYFLPVLFKHPVRRECFVFWLSPFGYHCPALMNESLCHQDERIIMPSRTFKHWKLLRNTDAGAEIPGDSESMHCWNVPEHVCKSHMFWKLMLGHLWKYHVYAPVVNSLECTDVETFDTVLVASSILWFSLGMKSQEGNTNSALICV